MSISQAVLMEKLTDPVSQDRLLEADPKNQASRQDILPDDSALPAKARVYCWSSQQLIAMKKAVISQAQLLKYPILLVSPSCWNSCSDYSGLFCIVTVGAVCRR